jgi:hypothetical protein
LRGAVYYKGDDEEREARTFDPAEHAYVRFDDLDSLLRSYDFLPSQSGSHVTYEHSVYGDQRVTGLLVEKFLTKPSAIAHR